ncbi:tubulin-specific chaperone cofactor E-like protein [Trichonephila inaurata madagascariensis]|uniref:Tubulin-specific chaperone cofactor E-like protein n=1 Tax=Trichonephila inaurata madagascariensis TaxID=2747483 RepID=A0A8X7CK29_9ARAC|nr:tubulin-specific chaperone cofactor E-like protein [Trichonephila inaurata madagascariensis]
MNFTSYLKKKTKIFSTTLESEISFFITMPSCSFSEALEIRYVEDIDANPIEPCEIFLVGSFPGRSSPSGRLVLPRTLTLNCCGIDRAGVLRKIDELCHDVEELDLAQNELSDLNEVRYYLY